MEVGNLSVGSAPKLSGYVIYNFKNMQTTFSVNKLIDKVINLHCKEYILRKTKDINVILDIEKNLLFILADTQLELPVCG